MSLPRYPEYKDSGVAWLGEVPIHWEVTSLKRSFKIIGGSTPKSDRAEYWDGSVVWVSPADLSKLSSIYINDSARKITEEGLASCGTTLVPSGSIVLSTRAPIGSLAIATTSLCTNQGCKALVPSHAVQSRFFAYLLLAVTNELNIRGKGTTFLELSTDELGAFKATLPCREEQTAIATFLDRETAKIDALIAEQEKLLALLAEKRQATISHAVTKGLNPDAPMKDSGVEWLGEVPEHWEIGNLKRFAKVIDCKHHTVGFLDEGLPIVSIRELRDNRIDLSNAKLTSPEEWEFLREGRIPKQGDLIFCRNASIGAIGYVDANQEEFCMGQDVCLIRPQVQSPFMYFQLMGSVVVNQIEAFLVGATIRRANVEEIRNLLVTWPPASEQYVIAHFLKTETDHLNALTVEATLAITLLKERRTALISAAATGKIDVRGLVTAQGMEAS